MAGVSGSACGYYSKVGLFGGPEELRGCGQTVPPGDERSASPSVTLPPDGSSTAVTAEDDGALAQYGPAILFGGKALPDPSGPIKVSTRGKKSVTSSASVKNVGTGPFTATSVRSACSASQTSGATGSTTVTGGVLVTKTDADGNPTKSEKIPSKPPANYTRRGVNAVGDKFKAVFNEQKKGRDGSITVTGVHLYLLGPNATGEVVVAQSRAKA
ncbi:MAG TPA: choice-of-anchor P family protein [Acidimicrobiales bacterium]|nr:choice-of-anchor P family protein [Acidimicrobiales bacterium]